MQKSLIALKALPLGVTLALQAAAKPIHEKQLKWNIATKLSRIPPCKPSTHQKQKPHITRLGASFTAHFINDGHKAEPRKRTRQSAESEALIFLASSSVPPLAPVLDTCDAVQQVQSIRLVAAQPLHRNNLRRGGGSMSLNVPAERAFSDPARSATLSFDVMTEPSGSFCCSEIVRTACERDDCAFISVEPTIRFALPLRNSGIRPRVRGKLSCRHDALTSGERESPGGSRLQTSRSLHNAVAVADERRRFGRPHPTSALASRGVGGKRAHLLVNFHVRAADTKLRARGVGEDGVENLLYCAWQHPCLFVALGVAHDAVRLSRPSLPHTQIKN
eukprot:6205185-Pleurochrysis_carterae.AAC.10